MRNTINILFLLTFICFTLPLSGQPIQLSPAPESGFSPDRLARIAPVMQSYIDDNKTGGIISMIYRKGKVVHLETYGSQDKEMGKAME